LRGQGGGGGRGVRKFPKKNPAEQLLKNKCTREAMENKIPAQAIAHPKK